MNLCTSVFADVCSIGLYIRIVNADTQSIRIVNADGQGISICDALKIKPIMNYCCPVNIFKSFINQYLSQYKPPLISSLTGSLMRIKLLGRRRQ